VPPAFYRDNRPKAEELAAPTHQAPRARVWTSHPPPQDECDARIERLAQSVLANPEAYLSTQQAEVLTAPNGNQPDRKLKDIAAKDWDTSCKAPQHDLRKIA
jgi:hypothetical protein